MNILIVDDELMALNDFIKVVSKVVPDAALHTANTADKAVRLCRESAFDVAFLDIQMPGRDGLSLAREIQKISPDTNIIFITAYDQYALDAFRLFASGYIMKPAMADEVRDVLDNLRHQIKDSAKSLSVQCFGDFEIFYDGTPVQFHRRKSKELLAFLIDRRGSAVNTNRICSVLWEHGNIEKSKNYLRQIIWDLRRTLRGIGAEDVISSTRDSYAIDTTKIDCDYYRYLSGDPKAIHAYNGEYMNQYSWAELTHGNLEL